MNATKQATHTPGPLDVSKCATPDYAPQYTLYDADGRRVATVFSEADANLFAAAPDLLAALRDAAQAFDEAAQHGYWDAAVERRVAAAARAALARVAP